MVPKIGSEIDNYKYYVVDFIYIIKNKTNQIIKRNERVYIFGIEQKIGLLDNKNTKEVFLDITFKIIRKIQTL